MLNPRKTRLLLLLILLLYLLLAVGYGVVNPLFEAPDEQHHFFTTRFIAANRTLPTTETAGEMERQEAAQPPLYYLLAAPLVLLADDTSAEVPLWSNPTVLIGEARPINVNSFVHTDVESWPWQGYARAAHLVRILSAVIGLGTLLCIFGAGRLIWPETPATALLATALVAFLPQFGFLHGAISNDVLIIFLSSFALWQLLHLWQNGTTTVRLFLLGLTIGLAILTKMAGLLLLPLSILVLGMRAWCDRQSVQDSRRKVERAWWMNWLWMSLLVVLPALLLSGWLFWRNWTNYGDITAANQFVALAGGDRHFSLRQVWHDMDRVAMSAVAFFGWMNVQPPRWLYILWVSIFVLAGVGWLFTAWQKPDSDADSSSKSDGNRRLIALWMGAWVALVFIAWLRFMMQTPADQGRLLFPALLPVALFTAHGLVSWRQRWLPWIVALCALFTSVFALVVVIPGAYNMAELLTEQEIPGGAIRVEMEMGQGIELVAVEMITEEVRPGEWVWVDLYWRAMELPVEAPFERLGLYGREGALAGRQVNYHGGGNYPATEWPVGKIVKDRLGVQLVAEAELPVQLRLLLRIDEAQEPREIARVKAIPAQWPQPKQAPLATFGEEIELTAVSVMPLEVKRGEPVAIDVQWRVKKAPGKALTTFVHLGDPTQAPLAQGDGPALDGEYPTNLWAEGEVIADRYVLPVPEDLPSGNYPLHIGFYDPQSGTRLPSESAGQAQPYDSYLIGSLTVGGE